jgi:hypothetical protein
VVKTWSDDEVALRWWNLFPQRKNKDGTPAVPTDAELDHIRKNSSGLQEKRRRLSNVSWFMKCLSEPIAKRGNREEKTTGHFWEARYKAQPLLDETAITACLAYVDLNPIRAGLAVSPETSEFTSVKERISDRQEVATRWPAQKPVLRELSMVRKRAGWLRLSWHPSYTGESRRESQQRDAPVTKGVCR